MTDFAFPAEHAERVVQIALDEDLGPENLDVTTFATIPADQQVTAEIVARADGVIAGLPIIALVLRAVADRIGGAMPTITLHVDDGDRVERRYRLATISGQARVILIAERTLLNILSRTSGVATHTRRWADALEGTGAMVLDTRKTTPGLRWLEKYAVRCGGGTNKRMGLYDVAMIKDNHKIAAGGLAQAFDAVRRAYPEVDIQVEATTMAEALEAVHAGARFLLLDNFEPESLAECVAAVRAERADWLVELEATGGLTLEMAREYASTGVDYLSVGGLTHSSPILDIALDLEG